jgi:hypothetical protein
MTTLDKEKFARSWEDAAQAIADFAVVATKHHWKRGVHEQAKASAERTRTDIARTRARRSA